MIATMYKRRMNAAFALSSIVMLIGISVFFIDRPDSLQNWLNLSSIGIVGLFLFFTGVSNQIKYNKVKDIQIHESKASLLELDHLVLKKDLGFFPRLLLFEKSGHFVGTIKPIRIAFIFYPMSLLLRDSLIMALPITYGVFSNKGNVLFTFKRKGMKKSIVTVKNVHGRKLGEYVQEDWKSLVNIKGELRDADDKLILPVKVKAFSGDFTLTDSEGRQWARFYNGYFPHEYTNIFRDVYNDIVELSDNLSKHHKMLLIAMIGFLFLQRNQ
ncbi:hypothetical protein NSR00_04000 [Aeribacillus sp. FSL K6-8394]